MAKHDVRSMSRFQKVTMMKVNARFLLKTMYGTQDASHVWQLDYTALLLEKQGKAWSSVFARKEHDVKLLVHGDDFFVLADQEGQDDMRKLLAKKYGFRCDGMTGPDEPDDTRLTILNRIVSLDKSKGVVSCEADTRHAEMIIRQLQLENAKPVTNACGEEEAG